MTALEMSSMDTGFERMMSIWLARQILCRLGLTETGMDRALKGLRKDGGWMLNAKRIDDLPNGREIRDYDAQSRSPIC
jgi:hypothetical protein